MSAAVKIEKFHTKPINVGLIQFNGKNGREIVEHFRSKISPIDGEQRIRNGGNWLQVSLGDDFIQTIKNGDYLVEWPMANEGSSFSVLRKDELEQVFEVGHVLQKVTTTKKRRK